MPNLLARLSTGTCSQVKLDARRKNESHAWDGRLGSGQNLGALRLILLGVTNRPAWRSSESRSCCFSGETAGGGGCNGGGNRGAPLTLAGLRQGVRVGGAGVVGGTGGWAASSFSFSFRACWALAMSAASTGGGATSVGIELGCAAIAGAGAGVLPCPGRLGRRRGRAQEPVASPAAGVGPAGAGAGCRLRHSGLGLHHGRGCRRRLRHRRRAGRRARRWWWVAPPSRPSFHAMPRGSWRRYPSPPASAYQHRRRGRLRGGRGRRCGRRRSGGLRCGVRKLGCGAGVTIGPVACAGRGWTAWLSRLRLQLIHLLVHGLTRLVDALRVRGGHGVGRRRGAAGRLGGSAGAAAGAGAGAGAACGAVAGG